MSWRSIAVVMMLAGMAVLYGCGGGSGGSGYIAIPHSTQAVVSFSAISSAHPPVQISGINVTVTLPSGVSVSTESGTSQISSSALVAGSALDSLPAGNKMVLGSYDSATQRVSISAIGTSSFGSGEYARLTCTVAAGTTLSQSGIVALNTPPAAFQVFGYDNNNNTVPLTAYFIPQFALK